MLLEKNRQATHLALTGPSQIECHGTRAAPDTQIFLGNTTEYGSLLFVFLEKDLECKVEADKRGNAAM